ncbi:MAG: hypothetical protein RJB61_940 [Actinomycetota bacterium]
MPHRGHESTASSGCTTAAEQCSQRWSDLQDRQASTRARPGALRTHTTRRRWSRRSSISRDPTIDRLHGSTSERSSTSTCGQVASPTAGGCPSQCRAASVGAGEISQHEAPARRARSTSTSRACHVGDRSSWYDSSCSSMTTTAASPSHGAHAALRLPTTTSTPPAADAHSPGTCAADKPARRSLAASAFAARGDGCTAIVGPRCAACTTSGSGSENGDSRWTSFVGGPGDGRNARRRGGRWATIVGGDAAARNGRSRPAPHLIDAHRAMSTTSTDGPIDDHFAMGTSRPASTPARRSSSRSTTQPPTRRPCRTTRTSEPTATLPTNDSGTR